MSALIVTADKRAWLSDGNTLTETPYTIEAAYLVEKSKVRGYGSMKGLRQFGDGIVVFWERVTEWWGPENLPPC